jgi:hypothetical protein
MFLLFLVVLVVASFTSLIEGVGFDNFADFLFDVLFWSLLASSHDKESAVDNGSNANSTGSASVGSSTSKALDSALKSNYKFHNVLAVLRRERTVLRGISAQDQFAKWAKQKRLVDALEEKANSLCKRLALCRI